MSEIRYIYLGPYAELGLALQTHKIDQCPQKAVCPNPTEGVYCPTCGLQVSKRFHEFQSTNPPMPDLLFKECREALMQADGMSGPQRLDASNVIYRLVGNQTRPECPREFWVESSDSMWMNLTQIDSQAEIAWFKKAYAAEWMKVQGAYGPIKFNWGLLQWFH